MKTLPLLDHHAPAESDIGGEAWKQHLRKWSIYAAATGAALATASRADADIIYSGPVDVTVTTGALTGKTFTINNHKMTLNAPYSYADLHFRGQQVANGSAALIRYAASVPVGGRYNFGSPGGSGGLNFGTWGPASGTGFAAFKTSGGDLGWIQIKVSDPDHDGIYDKAEILGYAYNDVPGAPINTGQLPLAPVPEPASVGLALLAIGASGLIAWRKRRAEAQPQ